MSSNSFTDAIKNELDSTLVETENGVLSYTTAGGEGKNLVDFNFSISAMRSMKDEVIASMFAKAYFENPHLAARYWAFCADVRGGLGERRTSRIIFDWLVENKTEDARKLLKLIPFYGRWDSLVDLIDSPLKDEVVEIVSEQLKVDIFNCRSGKPFSLLAKWCPSENTSSKKTREKATALRNALDLTPRKYRKMLSELRAALNVVEVKMSANKWGEIDYNGVPSKANLIYRNAFSKHDSERRKEYLDRLSNGNKDVKINSSVAFPCDIVNSYVDTDSWIAKTVRPLDTTLEEMWKALPDYVNGNGNNVLVVADSSASMMETYGNTKMKAWSVAQSLAVYFSERASGPFKDKYIMFSQEPYWVEFDKCTSLRDKLAVSCAYNDCTHTDFYRTMKLILDAAVKNNLSQDEIPSTLLVVSDMQFDYGTRFDVPLMKEISEEYEKHGYKLPKMVFWNVIAGCGRDVVVPMQRNDQGVILLSGFSSTLMTMALSGEISPYRVLLEKLNSERYNAVSEAIG